jgi:dipeptidyl-peptidase-4
MTMSRKFLPATSVLLSAVVLLVFSPVWAQETPSKITYEQAYLDKEPLLFKPMTMASWLDDEYYLLRERDEKTKTTRLFKVSVKSAEKNLFLDYGALQRALPQGVMAEAPAEMSPDYSKFIYNFKNDLYLFLPKTETFRRLTATAEEEKNPRLSPDGRLVAYTRGNNLYALDLDNGLEYQVTADGSETILNGWASWVYFEEILGRRSRYAAFWWSPDSRKIAFLRFDDSPVPVFPLFRSTGVHGDLEKERYPKSGDPNPKVKLGIVELPANTTVWADFDEDADHYVAWPIWLPGSDRLTVQWMNRGQDNIKIFFIDLKTGGKEEIFNEKQPAWVEFFEDLTFFKEGNGFLLRSDADGWQHLYSYDLMGKLRTRLTEGPWQVRNIGLVDEKNGQVYFSADKGNSTETHLFRVRLDGRDLERLTKDPGSHYCQVSPGGSYFFDMSTSVERPSKQDLYRSDGTWMRTIDSSEAPALQEYALAKKELFTIPTEDGYALPAYWILPPDFDPAKKYPVLFTIYGGPGAPTVSNSYPPLPSLYLAQEGIIVMSVDHRSSGHFGKKGVALMHRNLGKWEMHDLIAAVKWLREKPFIDPTKIGITGGSYGGYTTCMALTYGADYFTHGIAVSSVTDWRLYDSVYTERYMDTPVENKEGYEFGSAVTHAKNLKGVLLLMHGDMDDNVHMQNTVQLIDVLMDQGKMFEFMVFPNQRHGFREATKRENANRRVVDFWFKHLLDR